MHQEASFCSLVEAECETAPILAARPLRSHKLLAAGFGRSLKKPIRSFFCGLRGDHHINSIGIIQNDVSVIGPHRRGFVINFVVHNGGNGHLP